jgi:hypothetical protein
MVSWMKRAPRELQLIDENGVWNTDRVRKYLGVEGEVFETAYVGYFSSCRAWTDNF